MGCGWKGGFGKVVLGGECGCGCGLNGGFWKGGEEKSEVSFDGFFPRLTDGWMDILEAIECVRVRFLSSSGTMLVSDHLLYILIIKTPPYKQSSILQTPPIHPSPSLSPPISNSKHNAPPHHRNSGSRTACPDS